MASTIPLKTTIEIASRYIYNAPLLYVNSGALAYSLGDEVRQFILSPPFVWRWNRAEALPITCIAGQSDYTVNIPDFGFIERAWIAFPPQGGNSMNILTATRTGNVVTLQVGGNPVQYGFGGGQTITVANVTDGTFNGYQAFQITNLTANTISYAQTGSNTTTTGGVVINYNSTSQNPQLTKELTVSNSLAKETVLGQPGFISVVEDDNNGNVTFRLMMIPDQNYSLYVIYQKAAPSFGATTDTWAPIPDYMAYIFNKGFLAKAYEYKGDERFAYTWQEFMKLLVSANEGLSETQKNIFLEGKLNTAREQGALASTQQARQVRGGA